MATTLERAELPFLDIRDPRYLEDPIPILRDLRAQGVLARSERGVEVLSYELLASLLNDRRMATLSWEHFNRKGAPPIVLEFLEQGLLLNMKRDRHDRVRRVMRQGFRPPDIAAMRPRLEGIAHRIADGWAGDGRCDLTLDFSHQYSIEALCTLIGVPAGDIPVFAKATLEIVHLLSVPFERTQYRLAAGLEGLRNYAEDLVAHRRALPADRRPGDFIDALIAAEDDDRLIGDELIWGIANLLFAGHDTTRYQMVSSLRGLIETGQWEDVADDPRLAGAVVEEGMRLYGVVNFLSREVQEDVELEGMLIPAGTVLCLNMLACGRDPERFDDPDRFDIHREPGRRVPFGHGLHKCLGDQLARLEMEIAVEVLTARLREPRLDGPIRMTPWTQGILGAEELPIAFTARPRRAPSASA
ncbi:cytochrome P450 [Capillimicrobium parvum]|uniref:Cytochrome P450 n=1 Tax=Capillimicrobium parvum TaxID=2884022 RepID=A0A9E6XUR7_9ACTN|nr:cytochrome P450 [Capillimicrobium parvum]UGS34835.1 hypothetical protein DSM104329_01217 [Capillimicrobium parvum]